MKTKTKLILGITSIAAVALLTTCYIGRGRIGTYAIHAYAATGTEGSIESCIKETHDQGYCLYWNEPDSTWQRNNCWGTLLHRNQCLVDWNHMLPCEHKIVTLCDWLYPQEQPKTVAQRKIQ